MEGLGLTIEPVAGAWRGLVSGRRAHAWSGRFREQSGLPAGVPVVMTGHQPVLWHPGILAKYLAAGSAAGAVGGSAAWVVVDQDEIGAVEVRYPRVERGVPRAGRVVLSEGGAGESHAAGRAVIGDVSALRAVAGDGASRAGLATAEVGEGIERIARALEEARAGAGNLAEQVAGALAGLMEPLTPAAPTVFASRLSRTDAFAALWERMVADAEGCARAYNEAAAAFPGAGIRELSVSPGRVELPVWRLEAGKPRRRVFSDGAAGLAVESLAPRALFMTGLLRLCGADLFIHGTGGHAYDRVTERWLGAWVSDVAGRGAEGLAPTALVTATLRIRPAGFEAVEPEAAWAARGRARRAWHDPAVVGDGSAAREKGELVAAIRAAPRGSAERRALFRRLHEGLARYRGANAAGLAALDGEARGLEERLAALGVLRERGWPFPLYGMAALEGLRGSIEREFGGTP